jgi:hypothetical protein
MACKPLPHSRFSVKAGVSTGIPALTAATREIYMSSGSVWINVAENQMIDSFRFDARARDSLAGDNGCQVRRGFVFQAVSVLADRRMKLSLCSNDRL